MSVKDEQERVKDFDVARGWADSWNVKDLLLNITEEGGELWNLVKWVDDDAQKKVIDENMDEAVDYVGDTLYLVLKLANQMGVDVKGAFDRTMLDYEKRFPTDKMKKIKHGNKYAGGWDDKEAVKNDYSNS